MFGFFHQDGVHELAGEEEWCAWNEARQQMVANIQGMNNTFVIHQADHLLQHVDRLANQNNPSAEHIIFLTQVMTVSTATLNCPCQENIDQLHHFTKRSEGYRSPAWLILGKALLGLGASLIMTGLLMKLIGFISLIPSASASSWVVGAGFLVAGLGAGLCGLGRWATQYGQIRGLAKSQVKLANSMRSYSRSQ